METAGIERRGMEFVKRFDESTDPGLLPFNSFRCFVYLDRDTWKSQLRLRHDKQLDLQSRYHTDPRSRLGFLPGTQRQSSVQGLLFSIGVSRLLSYPTTVLRLPLAHN